MSGVGNAQAGVGREPLWCLGARTRLETAEGVLEVGGCRLSGWVSAGHCSLSSGKMTWGGGAAVPIQPTGCSRAEVVESNHMTCPGSGSMDGGGHALGLEAGTSVDWAGGRSTW